MPEHIFEYVPNTTTVLTRAYFMQLSRMLTTKFFMMPQRVTRSRHG